MAQLRKRGSPSRLELSRRSRASRRSQNQSYLHHGFSYPPKLVTFLRVIHDQEQSYTEISRTKPTSSSEKKKKKRSLCVAVWCSIDSDLLLRDFARSNDWHNHADAILCCYGTKLRGNNPHLVKKMKFGIFNFFLLGAVNKHPNCTKMKFEVDLTSIMVTGDFFGTATTTLFAPTRQGNGCGVDGNHDVGGRGWRLVLMRPMNTMTPFPRQSSRS